MGLGVEGGEGVGGELDGGGGWEAAARGMGRGGRRLLQPRSVVQIFIMLVHRVRCTDRRLGHRKEEDIVGAVLSNTVEEGNGTENGTAVAASSNSDRPLAQS